MPADRSSEEETDLPKFGEIINELSLTVFRHLNSNQASARVLKKHWLLAQAEILKGYQEVIRMELAETDEPKPEKKTKIVVE